MQEKKESWKNCCPECKEEFTPMTVVQIYCSRQCGERYRRRNKGKIKYPSVTFACSQCGKTVVTEEGSKDKRTRFCSASCEKKYWRHPHWENPSTRINFRSLEEYERYEQRTNNI